MFSERLFYPEGRQVKSCVHPRSDDLQAVADEVYGQMRSLISRHNYPCVAALQSLFRNEFRLGVYDHLGDGALAGQLAKDLTNFLVEQKRTQSQYLSFWAVFPRERDDPRGFEERLWAELSALSGLDRAPWDPHFSDDPAQKNFCFSFGGDAFYVVGLHPGSPRQSRQFPVDALVFNAYAQFRQLNETGGYQPMIEINRQRDLKFQGSVNPTVEKFGDDWEAIQFSGETNDEGWKCPFHRGTPV